MTRPHYLIASAFAAIVFLAGTAQTHVSGAEDDFTSLFNGKNLEGWRGDTSHWSVEEGAITGKTTAENLLTYNTFLIWDGGQPGDFELRLKYRIVGGNSGIQYRSRVIDNERYIVSGYQADVDSSTRYSGINYDEKGRGILAERGEKVEIAANGTRKVVASFGNKDELQQKIHNEDWNDYVIIAKGNHLQHWINGNLMSEVIDHQKEKAATSGIIALQLHQGPPMTVQFKDIRIKR